eukprot:COSAG01_NODE_2565_length_7448_cov_405.607566_8_plen_76_part_00
MLNGQCAIDGMLQGVHEMFAPAEAGTQLPLRSTCKAALLYSAVSSKVICSLAFSFVVPRSPWHHHLNSSIICVLR